MSVLSKETTMTNDDDSDHNINEEELLLMMFIKAAPDVIRERILQRIREQVSIKAAEAAAALMLHIETEWDDVTEMLAEVKSHLDPELQGPTAPPAERADPLKQLLGAIFGVSPEAIDKAVITKGEEGGYLVPTEGCSCSRCQHILEKAKAGIRIRVDGTEESTKEMN